MLGRCATAGNRSSCLDSEIQMPTERNSFSRTFSGATIQPG
jgi:hypothetical protein